MIPHHANKTDKKYHYYVSESAENDHTDNATRIRLPIQMIEDIVRVVLMDALKSDANLLLEQIEKLDAEAIQLLSKTVQELAKTISTAKHSQLKEIYRRTLQKIVIGKDQLGLFLNRPSLMENRSGGTQSREPICITKPICIKRRG